jgi:murein DD-endopeptidase MepM/ murein hydrolase activator NlpD
VAKKFLLQKNNILVGLVLILSILSIKVFYDQTLDYAGPETASGPESNNTQVTTVAPIEETFPHLMVPGTTLYTDLSRNQISGALIQKIVNAAKPVADLRKIRPGTRYQLYFSPDDPAELDSIKFRFSALESVEVRKEEGVWVAEKILADIDIKVVAFSGLVTSTLWESAQDAKMDFGLISELSEVFAWQVDFAREVRVNDRWRLTVEQKLVKGEHYGWGSILAAEFENQGQVHSAALFRQDGKDMGYFSPTGASLRRMFLRSPMRFSRVSSRFQKLRMHPILKVLRAHQGVDYAASVGTPIRTVGDGVVKFAGWSGGGGKVVRIRHNSTYETAYKHMSGFAKSIRVGASIQQGQVIGYVGNTGLSTGAHLHFEFFVNGRYVDPLGRKFPTAEPVASQHLSQFKVEAQKLLSELPSWDHLTGDSDRSAASTTTGG